jgi:endonuclease/exonuclease/phosphatase (EEP) superfamily protein YafD
MNEEEFKATLTHLEKQISLYRHSALDGNVLNEILQQVTATLYFLEEERSKFHKAYESMVHAQVKQGNSVARAKNIAEVEVPQLYHMRRLMDSGYTVVDAIRTHISWIKNEKQSI